MIRSETIDPAQRFHRAVPVDQLSVAGAEPDVRVIAASAAERRALAERFGLIALDELTAEMRLARRDSRVHLRVNFTAAVIQSCVVTLEPVSERIAHTFEREYLLRAAAPGASVQEVQVTLGDDDEAELLHGNEIDLGEAVAEELALALNPYPRTPGLAFVGYEEGQGQRKSPFRVLESLKERLGR